jgi:hypothetical protein
MLSMALESYDSVVISEPPSHMEKLEGLPVVRLMMIISSLTPLFVLWAVRGMQPVPDRWLIAASVVLILVPNAVLLGRLAMAKSRGDKHTLAIDAADDHRDHLLVYLFAMLIPLFDANVGKPRDSMATVLALVFVIFVFWHLNLHYMNILFALWGYKVFTIRSSPDAQPVVLLTQRSMLTPGTKVQAFRLSNTVFIERN